MRCALLVALLALPCTLHAQAPTWDASFGAPRYVSDNLALGVGSDGYLVAAGQVRWAGGIASHHVVRWAGARWVNIGADRFQGASTVATGPGGHLATLATVGNEVVVSRYDGTVWTDLGAVPSTSGIALALGPTGQVCAAGAFAAIGGVALPGAGCYDGTTWQPLGTGLPAVSIVHAATFDAQGRLLVGGKFDTAGGVTVHGLARWNGTAWEALGSGPAYVGQGFEVTQLALDAAGVLYIGAIYPYPGYGDYAHAQRFDGTAWSLLSINTNLTGSFFNATRFDDLVVTPDGSVEVLGSFTQAPGSVDVAGWARWDGAAWGPARAAGIHPEATPTRLLFPRTGPTFYSRASALLLRQEAGAWRDFGDGLGNQIQQVTVGPDGSVYAVTGFHRYAGMQTGGVARWDGQAWQPLGTGVGGCSSTCQVSAVAVLPTGEVVVGGTFRNAGMVAAAGIARWDGVAWSALGSSPGSTVQHVVASTDGTLAASFASPTGAYIPHRWTGSAWARMGTLAVSRMQQGEDGLIYATGFFESGTPRPASLYRWNGTDWDGLGPQIRSGDPDVTAFQVDASGTVHAVAALPGRARLRVLDGAAWRTLSGDLFDLSPPFTTSAPQVNVLESDGQGGWYVGGVFNRAYAANEPLSSDPYLAVRSLARWSASGWEDPTGGVRYDSTRGVTRGEDNRGTVFSLARQADTLWVGGFFHKVGGDVPADGITRLFLGQQPVTGVPARENVGGGLTVALAGPHPARGTLHLRAGQAGRLTAYDALGRLVYRDDVPAGPFALDVAAWSPGLYLVRLQAGAALATQTVVIAR